MKKLSIIIPVRNRADKLERLLNGLYCQGGLPEDWEVVVVDDASVQPLAALVARFGAKYIKNPIRRGPAVARNLGAAAAEAEVLFFIDSDCTVDVPTLKKALKRLNSLGRGHILGGTYRPVPEDHGFFNDFQSLFIHYSETREAPHGDYIATHAMCIYKADFWSIGGFATHWLPMIEDVEFSHRAVDRGMILVVEPAIQVGHHFGFGLWGSLKNAFKKAHYWSIYLLQRRAVMADSGTASRQLKFAVLGLYSGLLLAVMFGLKGIITLCAISLINGLYSAGLLRTFCKHKGALWCIPATLYWLFVYPLPVGLGGITGLIRYLLIKPALSGGRLCSDT